MRRSVILYKSTCILGTQMLRERNDRKFSKQERLHRGTRQKRKGENDEEEEEEYGGGGREVKGATSERGLGCAYVISDSTVGEKVHPIVVVVVSGGRRGGGR